MTFHSNEVKDEEACIATGIFYDEPVLEKDSEMQFRQVLNAIVEEAKKDNRDLFKEILQLDDPDMIDNIMSNIYSYK
jgi:hypothetical protein